MKTRLLILSLALLVTAWSAPFAASAQTTAEPDGATEEAEETGEKVDYLTDVQPILETFCYECHGEDASTREADLRLDIRERAFADLGGFPNIAPGDPADSELYLRVSAEFAELRMPPYEAGTQLTPEQIETIRLWIEQGAEWPEEEPEE